MADLGHVLLSIRRYALAGGVKAEAAPDLQRRCGAFITRLKLPGSVGAAELGE
jgi:hypothetical protein